MLERLHSLDDAAIAKRFAASERDDPLGFGLEDVVPLLVVALWPVVEGALSDLLAEDLKKARGRAGRVVRKWLRSRRIRRADRPALSTVQARRLRTAVEEAAQDLGMSAEDTADLVGRVMEGLKDDPGTDSDERTS